MKNTGEAITRARHDVRENMRVPHDELLADAVRYIREIKSAFFFLHTGMEYDLQENVAQFLA